MKQHLFLLQSVRIGLHASAIALAFFLSFHIRSVTDLIPGIQLRIPPLNAKETLIFAIIAIVLFWIIGGIQQVYSIRIFRQSQQIVPQLFLIRFACLSSLAYLGFGFLFVGGISRFILIIATMISCFMILIIEKIWNSYYSFQLSKLPIAIYGKEAQETTAMLQQLTHESPYHYQLITDKNQSISQQFQAIILVGDISSAELQERIDSARGVNNEIFHIPDHDRIEHALAHPQRFGSHIGWLISTTPLQDRYSGIKYLFDFIIASIALLFLSPLFLCIAFAIKRDSKGPVFYIQKRVGCGAKTFHFIKFRSMYLDDCIGEQYGGSQAWNKRQGLIDGPQNIRKGILQKIENDPRVTPVGRFLRKTSLDELPSLRNVLQGDMSLVGPRPHMPHEVAQYLPWHKRLLTIKPGITGYAQLYGRDKVPFDEEAKLDLWYIQHWSFSLDLYILLATIKVVVKGS